jgi:hypothetical protein
MTPLQKVKDGQYTHNWFVLRWHEPGIGDIELEVSSDALKIDNVRWAWYPTEFAEVCALLGAVPLTPKVADHRYNQSALKNLPCPKYYPQGRMNSEDAIKEHSKRIDESVSREHAHSVGVPGKVWTWPLELEGLYGMHVMSEEDTWRGCPLHNCESEIPGLKVIQPASLAHTGQKTDTVEKTHRDYCMVAVVANNTCEVNGTKWKTEDLYREMGSINKPEIDFESIQYGSVGNAVLFWQNFLNKYSNERLATDGKFGALTHAATCFFQKKYGLKADGKVGSITWATSFEVAELPVCPFTRLTEAKKTELYGLIEYRLAPRPGFPGWVEFTNQWHLHNLTRIYIPEIKHYMTWNIHAIDQLLSFWKEVGDTGLTELVISHDGDWVSRKVRRGSKLSDHARGTAFDINAAWNPFHRLPAEFGERGCILPLVPIAFKHGFGWYPWDGMHFQIAELRKGPKWKV